MKNHFCSMGSDKKIYLYEFYGKTDKKMNTTLQNMTYLVDNKKNVCQHNKLHLLIARKGEWISETMYGYIEKSFSTIHCNTSL